MKYLITLLLFPFALSGQMCENLNEQLGIKEPVYTAYDFEQPECECLRIGVAVFINQDLVDLLGPTLALATVQNMFEIANIPYDSIGIERYISDVRYVDVQGNTTSDLWIEFSGYQNSPTEFVGDIAQLYTQLASGGIALLDQIGLSFPFSVSSVRVNDPDWTRKVLAHESAHVIGSKHTHSCAWGPNQDEAQDRCAGFTELGECDLPLSNTGGIMSYCHLGGNDIEWFGVEQAALLRNRIATRIGCDCEPPPPNDECQGREVVLNIVFDSDPDEISWTFGDAHGGPYLEGLDFATDTFCVENECIWFVINDSAGDGLLNCVEGFYSIDGNTSSDFGFSDSILICHGQEPPPPTHECGLVDINIVDVQGSGAHTQVFDRVVLTSNLTLVAQGPFTIDNTTTLALKFNSPIQGNYQGIGFSNTLSLDDGVFFKLFGRDDYGYTYLDYYESSYNWLQIPEEPIGAWMAQNGQSGTYQYMFLVNSNTSFPFNAQSAFRDIELCTGDESVLVMPLPVKEYRLINTLGQVVRFGKDVSNLSGLPKGVYYQVGGINKKIIVQ